MSAAARMYDASAAESERVWDSNAPPQLVGRYEEIKAAAIALAYAARPRGVNVGAVSYWHTLPACSQQSHTLRAVHATAEALRIPTR